MYRWLWRLLKPLCDKLVLADATELACRRGKRRPKTDPMDARHLAKLLYIDDVPEAYVPEGAEFDLRRLGRQWHRSSQALTSIKVRMRWFMNQANLRGPQNINSPSARRWLQRFGPKLDSIAAYCSEQLLCNIEHIELQQERMRRCMRSIMDTNFSALSELLQTVPGIAAVNAAVIIGEAGNFHRFYSAEAFACYTGLTERLRESAGKKAKCRISKAGPPTLRWALVGAVTTLCRCDRYYKDRYERILRRSGIKKKAKTAMARKLSCVLWKMVQTAEPFKRSGSTNYMKAANNVRLARKKMALMTA